MSIQSISQANAKFIKNTNNIQPLRANPNGRLLTDTTAPIVNQPATQKKPFKLSKDAKKGIIMGGLAVVAGAFLAYKKHTTLPKFIEFQECKSIDEARAFAKKYLKVRKFELNNIDCANYVIEALCEHNNTSKGHARLISKITSATSTVGDGLPVFTTSKTKLFGQELKCYESNIRKYFKQAFGRLENETGMESFITKGSTDERIKVIYAKFKDKSKPMTFKEKMELARYVHDRSSKVLFDERIAKYAQLLGYKNCTQIIDENNYPITINEFARVENSFKTLILNDLMTKSSHQYVSPSAGPFGIINHELGHIVHARNVGFDNYNIINNQKKITHAQAVKIAKGDNKAGAIFSNASWRALRSDTDFVAEVYSYLKAGKKFCPEIMDKYKKLGGLIP